MDLIMQRYADELRSVPDIDVDLTGCGIIAANGLPPPVVVTLARRPDRWAAARDRLARGGFDRLIRADAVDGRQLSRDRLAPLLRNARTIDDPPDHYLQMTRPAVGCFLSHLAIWKQFLRSGEPYVLVLEDDAVPAEGLHVARGNVVMARMPPDADMLLLGCTIMDGLAEPTVDPAFTRVYYYNGTFAYILTRQGCIDLLPRLLPIETHIDNQISLELVRSRHGLRAYATEPRLFEHDFETVSDVYIPVADTTRADRMLDVIFKDARASLLREGAQLFGLFDPAG